jgi:hypothetical protein
MAKSTGIAEALPPCSDQDAFLLIMAALDVRRVPRRWRSAAMLAVLQRRQEMRKAPTVSRTLWKPNHQEKDHSVPTPSAIIEPYTHTL